MTVTRLTLTAGSILFGYCVLYFVVRRAQLERQLCQSESVPVFRRANADSEKWAWTERKTGLHMNLNDPDARLGGEAGCMMFFFAAPMFIHEGFKFLREAERIFKIDRQTCGAVMDYLFRRGQKATYDEIMKAVPSVRPATTFPQLHLLDGVLHLVKDPPGFALTEELREELDRVFDVGRA